VSRLLEASSERNRALYERHGFRVVERFNMPGGGPIRRMWRSRPIPSHFEVIGRCDSRHSTIQCARVPARPAPSTARFRRARLLADHDQVKVAVDVGAGVVTRPVPATNSVNRKRRWSGRTQPPGARGRVVESRDVAQPETSKGKFTAPLAALLQGDAGGVGPRRVTLLAPAGCWPHQNRLVAAWAGTVPIFEVLIWKPVQRCSSSACRAD